MLFHLNGILAAALFAPALVLPDDVSDLPLEAPSRPDFQAAAQPDPADVESIDAIIAAVYDVISGPAGEARDWQRWHSLFIPGARLIPVGRSRESEIGHRVMTPKEYEGSSGPWLEENGFFENEIGRTTEQFGEVAHLFSAYESRRTPDAEPFARGVNSFQLMYDGKRWWIVSIFWTAERSDLPIPEKYLSGRS